MRTTYRRMRAQSEQLPGRGGSRLSGSWGGAGPRHRRSQRRTARWRLRHTRHHHSVRSVTQLRAFTTRNRIFLSSAQQEISATSAQCCGTVTIFYSSGSGSGSEKLWFRFRVLKSYGFGSGSYFWKVTVPIPVPVPAPYLDHKKQIFQKNVGIFFVFLPSKLFSKEKVCKFQLIFCKMGMKKILNEGN